MRAFDKQLLDIAGPCDDLLTIFLRYVQDTCHHFSHKRIGKVVQNLCLIVFHQSIEQLLSQQLHLWAQSFDVAMCKGARKVTAQVGMKWRIMENKHMGHSSERLAKRG